MSEQATATIKVTRCGYRSDDDGSVCNRPAVWIVQRMPSDWAGAHKFVYVCDQHAKSWRTAIPYVYMEHMHEARPYPGQRCSTPYHETYLRTETIAAELARGTPDDEVRTPFSHS